MPNAIGFAPGLEEMLVSKHAVGDFPVGGGVGGVDLKRFVEESIRASGGVEVVKHDAKPTFLRSFV
jgi:hypothetical protein